MNSFTDQENISQMQFSHRPLISGIGQTSGKRFIDQRSLAKDRLRKPLSGNANIERSSILKNKNAKSQLKPIPELSVPKPIENFKPVNFKKEKLKQKNPIPKSKYDEIEYLADIEIEEDDFEDIWPSSERPTSVLPSLIAWRPELKFAIYEDECCDRDDEVPVLENYPSDEDEDHVNLNLAEEFDINELSLPSFTDLSSNFYNILC